MRVYIGTELRTEIPRKVLQWSILQHCSEPAEFVLVSDDPECRSLGAGTGFSLCRWQLPELNDYRGRVIYLDADQLVFGDLAELFDEPNQSPSDTAPAWCVYYEGEPETSVMVIDCERARQGWPRYDEVLGSLRSCTGAARKAAYRRVMTAGHLSTPPAIIDAGWNHLNRYEPGVTQLLHFTRQKSQPWCDPSHPLSHLWEEALRGALSDGAVDEFEIVRACARIRSWTRMHRHWLRVLGGKRAA